MSVSSPLPVLLPQNVVPKSELTPYEWKPKRSPTDLMPVPAEERTHDQEMAMARQAMDGKVVKKVRPRRTVDYGGPMGRWALLRKMRPSGSYVPFLRPAPPYIIDLLPPKAYPDNASTSLCTKFVHTSTNKIRCPVNCVTWTPEGRRVLTGSTSGEFTLWNGLTFNFETILQAHDSAVRTFQFCHSGAYLASADQSGVIKYFQPNMNNLTAWQGHREAIRGISFSPDDSMFATASDDATIRIWSFEERREEKVLTGHGWDVKCVEWHPTKGLLVSGSKDNMIKFWDPRTCKVLSTLHYHKNTVQALAWSPNGDLVASASRDQTVRVFDIRAMKEFRVLKGHKKEVCSVTWHPFHPLLISGGSEGSILHWDLSSSSSPLPDQSQNQQPGPRATLSQAHDSNVWSLAFHPLGHLLASASNDHTTRFWCRERPGDASSVFSGGGEKPPDDMGEMGGTGQGGDEDEDQFVVPGFGGYGTGGVVMPWGGKEEEETPTRGQGYHGGMNNGSGGGLGYDSFGRNHRSGGDRSHISTTTTTTTTTLSSAPPLGPSTSSTSSQSFPNMINTPGLNLPPSMDDSQDDFIPGLALPDGDLGGFSSAGGGGGGAYVAGRQNGPLPSQEDLYGHEDEHGGGNGSGGGGGFGWRGSGRSGGGAGGGSGGGGSGGGGGGGGGRRWGQRRRQH